MFKDVSCVCECCECEDHICDDSGTECDCDEEHGEDDFCEADYIITCSICGCQCSCSL